MHPVNHLSGKQKRGFVGHGWGLGKRLETGAGQNAESPGKGEERGVNDRGGSQRGGWEPLPLPLRFKFWAPFPSGSFSLVPGQYKVCCLLCSPSLRSSARGFPFRSSEPAALSRAELLGSPCRRARRSLEASPSPPVRASCPDAAFRALRPPSNLGLSPWRWGRRAPF